MSDLFTKENTAIHEQWKLIFGFSGRYEVSNRGRVRKGNKQCCLSKNKNGYLMVSLFSDNGWVKKYVHRLVIETFNPTIDKKLVCNHKDLNKRNNDIGNLEWVTNKENALHAARNGVFEGRKGSCNAHSKLNEKDIKDIVNLCGKVSARLIGKKYHVSGGAIYGIWCGANWAHISKIIPPGIKARIIRKKLNEQ